MSNQPNQNVWFEKVLPNLEFWVVVDRAWTDSAAYADIVLPACDFYEVMDIRQGQNIPYITMGDRVIDPLYDSKPDSEILGLIGRAMGYVDDWPAEYDHEYWPRVLLDSPEAAADGYTWEAFKEKRAVRYIGAEDAPGAVQGDEFLPCPTSHGRTMIYWEDPVPREDFGQEITPEMIRKERIPYWMEPVEAGKTSSLAEKYPLVFIQKRDRFRTHSQYFEVPWLQELVPDPMVRMGRDDMEARGIVDGDLVEVFNDRGHVVLKAMLDENYPAGVICIPKGWQRRQFVEGGYQELTNDHLDPWGVSGIYYDCRVDVRKWNE